MLNFRGQDSLITLIVTVPVFAVGLSAVMMTSKHDLHLHNIAMLLLNELQSEGMMGQLYRIIDPGVSHSSSATLFHLHAENYI